MIRHTVTLVTAALLSIGISACGKTGDQAFRARAAQDLSCPEGDLLIEHKWEGDQASKRAVGCGREALYMRECQHEGCLWKQVPPGTATSTDTASATSTGTTAPTSTDTAVSTGTTTDTTSTTGTGTGTATATASGTGT